MSGYVLPLPLQLNQPVALTADLETLFVESLGVGNTKYDPLTQMRAWGKHRGGGHNTSSKCVNYFGIQIDDILQDFSV